MKHKRRVWTCIKQGKAYGIFLGRQNARAYADKLRVRPPTDVPVEVRWAYLNTEDVVWRKDGES